MRCDDPRSLLAELVRRSKRDCRTRCLAKSSCAARGPPYPRTSVDLCTAVDAYLDHLRVERALAPNSISSYASDLAKLGDLRGAEGVTTTEAVDAVVITRFLVSLDRAGLGARSAIRHLSAVRGFCRFLTRERWIGADPTADIATPAAGAAASDVLSFEEVVRFSERPTARNRAVAAIAPCFR